MGSMVGILVFANWAPPAIQEGVWSAIFAAKWYVTGAFAILLGYALVKWFGAKTAPLLITSVVVLILAVLFPKWPLLAFGAGIAGLIVTTKRSSDEMKSWIDSPGCTR